MFGQMADFFYKKLFVSSGWYEEKFETENNCRFTAFNFYCFGLPFSL